MVLIGSRKRLCIGGWVLAALLLLGYNGLELMRLFDPSIPGISSLLKQVKQDWFKLTERDALNSAEKDSSIDLDRILARFIPDPLKRGKTSIFPRDAMDEEIWDALPELTGISQVLDVNGNIRSFAMIEGRRLCEHSEIKGFTVEKITSRGVILTRKGESWFICVPGVNFTLDKGG